MWAHSLPHCCLSLLAFTFINAASCHIKMKRRLSKDGFHRDIQTLLLLPETFVANCVNASIMIFETLPPGIYADPFQINSLEDFGGRQVYFGQPVNIEAPEYVSNPLELFIFLNLSSSWNGTVSEYIEFSIVLPIHVRYHEPTTGDTHAAVTILHPTLYTNCSGGGLSDSHTLSAPCDKSNAHQCLWLYMPFESESPHLVMHVPVGQKHHKTLVIAITLIVSIVISGFLTKVIFSYQHKSSCKVS